MKIRYSGNDVNVIGYNELSCGDFFILLNDREVEEFCEYKARNIYIKAIDGCASLTGMNSQFHGNESVIKIEVEISWREA